MSQTHNGKRAKGVAGKAKHEILATAVEFLSYVVQPLAVVFHGTFCWTVDKCC